MLSLEETLSVCAGNAWDTRLGIITPSVACLSHMQPDDSFQYTPCAFQVGCFECGGRSTVLLDVEESWANANLGQRT